MGGEMEIGKAIAGKAGFGEWRIACNRRACGPFRKRAKYME
jgi:hypothetical protein